MAARPAAPQEPQPPALPAKIADLLGLLADHDAYTAAHGRRVAALALRIGRAMGLAGQELDDLYHGALLHDLGKISISPALLARPVLRTSIEVAIVRRHPSIAIWQMNRQSVTILALPRASDSNWRIIGSGDFDRNGRADMIWRHAASGSNVLWLFTASGIVSTGLPRVSDLNWRMVSSGDLNGDRVSDIVWRHTTCGCNSVWFFSDGQITSVGLPRVADPNWRIVAGGDYNGDSKGDLLWRHAVYGSNAAWLMSGSRVATNVALGRTTDANWQLIGDSRVGLGAIEGPFSIAPDAAQAPITDAQALAELSAGPLSEMAVEAAGVMEVSAATGDAPTAEGAPEAIELISDGVSPTPDAQTRVFLPLLGR